MSVLLDTHYWVWWLTPDASLSNRERAALDAAAERRQGFLPAHAADERMLTIVPLDVAVVTSLDALPPTFHGDPADRLIVATARARHLPLATRDARIRRSRLTQAWKP